MSLKYCAHPNCSVLVPKGRCPQHERQQDVSRGTAQERGYTSRWNRFSHQFLRAHPVCGERADGSLDAVHSRCVQRGLTTPAQCVDHVRPKSQGGTDDESNLMSACFACNTWKANTIERRVLA
jgi:5-methylcytosine-specific restriction enzyme A